VPKKYLIVYVSRIIEGELVWAADTSSEERKEIECQKKLQKNKYSSKFYTLISRDFKHLSSVSPVIVATRWSEALPSVRHGLWPYNEVDSRGNHSRTNEHRNAPFRKD